MAERIRKAKEEIDRPRVQHEAAMARDGKRAVIWCTAAQALLIAAIVVALVKANYEVALFAGGGFCCPWFYLFARILDRRWMRGPSAADEPPHHPDGNG